MLSDLTAIVFSKELNSLLWTTDTPVVDGSVIAAIQETGGEITQPNGNMQCAAHALICAALVLGHEEQITTRGGSVLVVYPEQSKLDRPFAIMKHWWIVSAAGLCDFSLNLAGLSAHKPIIFQNRNVADLTWQIVFKDDFARIIDAASKCHATGKCGVFYQTDAKKVVSREEIEAEILNVFPPAEQMGIPLRYVDIAAHCKRFLTAGVSLSHLSQEEAWRQMASR